jgi:hypothetical protein
MNSTVVGSEDCLYLNVFTTYVGTCVLITAFKVGVLIVAVISVHSPCPLALRSFFSFLYLNILTYKIELNIILQHLVWVSEWLSHNYGRFSSIILVIKSTTEDPDLLGYDAASPCNLFPTFRRSTVPSKRREPITQWREEIETRCIRITIDCYRILLNNIESSGLLSNRIGRYWLLSMITVE